MKSTTNVTLADIAQKLDVSIVSVSKALAHKKGVSDILSRKISQLAQEMGYRQKVHVFGNEKRTTTGNIGYPLWGTFEATTSIADRAWVLWRLCSKTACRHNKRPRFTRPHMHTPARQNACCVRLQLWRYSRRTYQRTEKTEWKRSGRYFGRRVWQLHTGYYIPSGTHHNWSTAGSDSPACSRSYHKKITGGAYAPRNHVVSGRLILRDSVKRISWKYASVIFSKIVPHNESLFYFQPILQSNHFRNSKLFV